MAFDNLCKLLSEKYPDRFATWLLGQSVTPLKVLKTELSIEPIRADSITFLQTQDRILHLEFQVKLDSDPPPAPPNVGLLGQTSSPLSPSHHPNPRLPPPTPTRHPDRRHLRT